MAERNYVPAPKIMSTSNIKRLLHHGNRVVRRTAQAILENNFDVLNDIKDDGNLVPMLEAIANNTANSELVRRIAKACLSHD